ncbi:MAG: flagellar hook-length control protein FliK [Desulfarculus sp.]|nr:flagellar hook-length control protein FliK [Desulfarculus sp.]
MSTTAVNLDASACLSSLLSSVRKSASASGFDELLANLTSSVKAQTTTSSVQASQTSGFASTSAKSSPATTVATPIEQFKQALTNTGQAVEKMTLAYGDREKLQKVLEESGFSTEDAKQIIERAKDDKGDINLGRVFALLPQYLPLQGPTLTLNPEDTSLLVQVLKDLGLTQEQIGTFMERQITTSDGKIQVRGLPELLAQTDGTERQVDRKVLTDLLSRLGLGQKEIESLLAKSTDSAGKTSPAAMLAVLTVAAQNQDQGVGQALREMASRVKTSDQDQADVVDKLRAQVNQALDKIQQKTEAQTERQIQAWDKSLEQAKGALQEAGAATLGKTVANNLPGLETNPEIVPQVAKAALGAEAVKMVDQTQAAGQRPADHQLAQTTQAAQTVAAARAGAELGGQGAGAQAQNGQGRAEAWTGLGQAGAGERAQAAGTSAAAARVLPSYVTRQVGEQMAQMVAKQQTSLRLELKPPTLGELQVELSVKDGVVKATLTAETVAAKQALESGLDQLKQQLTAQGLKIDSLEVAINPDAERQHAQAEYRNQGGSRRDNDRGLGDRDSSRTADSGLASAPASVLTGPNVRSRVNLFA